VDDDDEQLQLALKLSRDLAAAQGTTSGTQIAERRPLAAATASSAASARLVSDGSVRVSSLGKPAAHSDALELSRQLARQWEAAAHAAAKSPAGENGPKARLQCRFPDLDAEPLSLTIPASSTLQPVLDAVVKHLAALVLAGVIAKEDAQRMSSVHVRSRMPSVAISFAPSSGLVRDAEPVGAHTATLSALGMAPSALLHVSCAYAD